MLPVLVMLRILRHVRRISRIRLLHCRRTWRIWSGRRRMAVWGMNKWNMWIWMQRRGSMMNILTVWRRIGLILSAHWIRLRRHVRILISHVRRLMWVTKRWHWRRRWAHIHWKVNIDTCTARRFGTWTRLLLVLWWNRDWWHKIRAIMIRPWIVHWKLNRFLWWFIFLFVVGFIAFLCSWVGLIKRMIHVRIIVVRRHVLIFMAL